jgi:hypothetical protein
MNLEHCTTQSCAFSDQTCTFAIGMRSIISIFLLGIIALSVFGQGVMVVRYYYNKQYIAAELCQNRARPMLHCEGKCVLARKLQEADRQEKQQGIVKTEKFEVAGVKCIADWLPAAVAIVLPQLYFIDFQQPTLHRSLPVFRPPDRFMA